MLSLPIGKVFVLYNWFILTIKEVIQFVSTQDRSAYHFILHFIQLTFLNWSMVFLMDKQRLEFCVFTTNKIFNR
jgi:hypothetical protein